MLRSPRWLALQLAGLLLPAASCQYEPVLLVDIPEWPAGASALRVNLWLDGEWWGEQTFAKEPGIPVPRPTGKSVQLLLDVMDASDCRIASSSAEVSPQPSLPLVRSIQVRFSPLPTPQCSLTVYLPSALSLLPPASTWMKCADGQTLCSVEVPRGELVQLQFIGKITEPKQYCFTDTTCSFRMERSLTVGIEAERETCGLARGIDFCTAPVQGLRASALWGKDGSVFAFMEGGTVLRWQNRGWVLHAALPLTSVRSVWGTSPLSIWAVGLQSARPAIVSLRSGEWTESPSPSTEDLNGIWGSGEDRVWAVGNKGTVLRWEGRAWALQRRFTDESLLRIWGADDSNIWALGDQGTIFRWDGASWSVEHRADQPLYGLHGSDVRNVWAVGARGTVLKYDGRSWAPEQSGTSRDLHDVRVCNALSVLAVGKWGGLLRKSDPGWQMRSISPTQALGAVWCDGAFNVWVASRSGQTWYNEAL